MVLIQLIRGDTDFDVETAKAIRSDGVTTFNIAGWVLFIMICGLYLLARRSQLKLLRKVMSTVLVNSNRVLHYVCYTLFDCSAECKI
jgi:hypothetical protein